MIAGAAGMVALDVSTYTDMALRGRGSSWASDAISHLVYGLVTVVACDAIGG